MLRLRRLTLALGLALAPFATHLALMAAPAAADAGQMPIIEDDAQMLSNPVATVARFRVLGASIVRIDLEWSAIAPKPTARKQPSFDASDSAAYPAASWERFDGVVRAATAAGLGVDLVLSGGSPLWADTNQNIPLGYDPRYAWYPSASKYGQFVTAAAKRYSGTYVPAGSSTPLPRVSFWTLWNEPNFGTDLGPQAIDGSTVPVAPALYRGLVDAGWRSLQATGHAKDTIVIGEITARGKAGPPSRGAPQGFPGNFAQTKPLQFVRDLYCVDTNILPLRGSAARALGCPTNAAGSRTFRNAHPALFSAGGFGFHPYGGNTSPPTDPSSDPDFATFKNLPHVISELDAMQRAYGARTRFPMYNDEYGYLTAPPQSPPAVSPTTAAYYINWFEYLSWKNPRVVSYMQYPFQDPPPIKGQPYAGYSSGLLTYKGVQKPAYYSYRLPLYLPVTTARSGGQRLEIWGGVRPAFFATQDTSTQQTATLQFQAHSRGQFTTLTTVKITSPQGYFDIRQAFPSSGTLRLTWAYPTGALDPNFPSWAQGVTVTSRTVRITVR
jgi:hypothetical protein